LSAAACKRPDVRLVAEPGLLGLGLAGGVGDGLPLGGFGGLVDGGAEVDLGLFAFGGAAVAEGLVVALEGLVDAERRLREGQVGVVGFEDLVAGLVE
jgi:hypothetical protein